jgi:hypothetical protein
MRWLWVWISIVIGLAGCSGGGIGGPTQTAIVIIEGTSPLDPAGLPTPGAVAQPTETMAAAASDTPAVSETATPAPEPKGTGTGGPDPAAVLGDPLLRTYRVMVSMQVAGELLAETAARVQAGELDEEDVGVAALAFGALVQSMDEDVPAVTPPAELAAAWQRALTAHEAIKARAGEWLLGAQDAGTLGAALAPSLVELEAALAQADTVVARTYGMEGPRLTEYREQIRRALGRLYDE